MTSHDWAMVMWLVPLFYIVLFAIALFFKLRRHERADYGE